jgi:hypothetical protein
MSSLTLSSAAVGRPAVNHWVVALVVVVPTFMEILDTTITNVGLRYIAGGLSAAVTDADWVITSYLAANAIVLPITGWLSARLGRRNYFLLSIAVFTIASGLCGMATSLGQIILFRVLQGLAEITRNKRPHNAQDCRQNKPGRFIGAGHQEFGNYPCKESDDDCPDKAHEASPCFAFLL